MVWWFGWVVWLVFWEIGVKEESADLCVCGFLVEFATVGKTKGGKIYHHLWSAEEIDALLKEHGLAKVEDAADS